MSEPDLLAALADSIERAKQRRRDALASSSLAQVNRDEPCGGIWVNGAEPKCCEVRLLPWGHVSLRDVRAES